MKYRWKDGWTYKGDAQAAGEGLAELREKHADRLTAPIVVDAARPPASKLHRYFEWNNDIAGERWRERQARDLMQHIEVIVSPRQPARRMFVTVTESVADETSRAYVSTARVLKDEALTAQVLDECIAGVAALKRRYLAFGQMAGLLEECESNLRKLIKKESGK